MLSETQSSSAGDKPQSDLPEIEKEIESGIVDSVAASNPQPNPDASQNLEDTSPQKPNDEPQKNSNLLKYLVIFLLIVVTLAFIGTEGYLMMNKKSATPEVNQTVQAPSPTPDPTANWQTYSTKDYSVKYDSSWTIESANPNLISISDPTSMQSVIGNGGGRSMTPSKFFTIWLKDTNQTVNQYVDQALKGPEYTGVDPERKSIQVGNNSGEIYKTAGEGSGNSYTIVFSNGSKVAIINIPNSNPSQDKIIWNMLSSFKFTDSVSAADTSDWKTYTAAQPGLSFKYPSTWTINVRSRNPELEDVELISKNGTIIGYATNQNFNGGACTDMGKNTINKVTPLANAKALNLIDFTEELKSGFRETMGISSDSPKVGSVVTDCHLPNLYFVSKSNPNLEVAFTLDSENINPADKSEVEQILQSLTY